MDLTMVEMGPFLYKGENGASEYVHIGWFPVSYDLHGFYA